MKRFLYVLFLLTIVCPSWADNNTPEEADNAYMQGHYEEAAKMYEEIIKTEANSAVYYNLGNTYYRMEDLGKAVLNYERALLLEPDNEDIQFNLELCKARTADQFNKPSEMFFITWLKELVYSKNADQWAGYSIICLVLGLILFGIYHFNGSVGVRKFGFFSAIFFFILVLLFNVAAAWNKSSYENDQRAVIVKQTHLFKSSNEKEEPLRELNPGTIFEIIDSNSRGWYEVVLPNGKKGWIQQVDAVKIKTEKK